MIHFPSLGQKKKKKASCGEYTQDGHTKTRDTEVFTETYKI